MASARLPGTAHPEQVSEVHQLMVHEHPDGTVSIYSGLPDDRTQRVSLALRLRDLLGSTVAADAAALGVSDGLLWRRYAHQQSLTIADSVVVELVSMATGEPVER